MSADRNVTIAHDVPAMREVSRSSRVTFSTG